ncbi:MAG: hypothetical protein KDC44_09020 [Phaeodactylibacter sp.]|nr:hypothetical protein [Phaeodactylibacter sp.]
MAEKSREALVALFQRGVTDKAYKDLIDSTFNKQDDQMTIRSDAGLILTPRGASSKLMSFSESIQEQSSPIWSVNFGGKVGRDKQGSIDLSITEGQEPRLYLQAGGNVGIGTDKPKYKLDVNGIAGMAGRVGTYMADQAPADGQWHTILDELDGVHGFEIMAHIIDSEDQRFGLTHALLLMSHGKKGYQNRVCSVEAGSSWLWGRFFNKLAFRWVVDGNNSSRNQEYYAIQIKSRTHYGMRDGDTKKIFFRVTKIWDREFESESYSRSVSVKRAKISISQRK